MRNREDCCDFCGQEIRSVVNTELLDGHICPDCAALLSPWFTEDLDCMEVDEIRQQLEGRERNRRQLKSFHPTRKFGYPTMVVVDDDAQTFVVTDSKDLLGTNPDILRIQDVDYCMSDVHKDRSEIGPKRYRYSYTFKMDIGVEHPYIDEITYALNEEPLQYESTEKGFLGMGGFDPEGEPDYDDLAALAEKIENVLTGEDDGTDDEKYRVQKGEFDGRPQKQEESLSDEDGRIAAGKVVNCPWCGCKTPVNDKFVCVHCGGPL